MQVVVKARPPLFAEIDAAFNIAGKAVFFSFGDKIYNPAGVPLTPELMAHEAVHGVRQIAHDGGVEGWWRHYIADPQWRLGEEILAHIAEYQEFCMNNTHGHARNARRLMLHEIAKRLASPLYGGLVRYEQARGIIKRGAGEVR